MKNLILLFIDSYQRFFSVFLKNILGTPYFCRFRPTCSEYAKQSIKEKGVLYGGYLSILRVLKCQPYFGVQHDSL